MAMGLLLAGSVGLTGCSWLGGGPSAEKIAAEQLRTPPNVLANSAPDGVEAGSGDSSRERVVVESSGGTRADPESFLTMVNGEIGLDVGLPPQAAWAIVGRAMERGGFAQVQANANQLTHLIRYDSGVAPANAAEAEAKGWLSGLAFWRDEPLPDVQEYRLEVVERGKGARITVHWADGTAAPAQAARPVLAVLAEQLKP